MFKSPVLQSGGPPVPYPKTVWTATGGWYCENKHWKRNTLLVGGGLMLMAAWLFNVSRTYERRYRPGPIPVLSASWAKHTLEDDPEYHERVASWNKRKKSMWDRVFQNEEDFIEE